MKKDSTTLFDFFVRNAPDTTPQDRVAPAVQKQANNQYIAKPPEGVSPAEAQQHVDLLCSALEQRSIR